MSASTSRWTTNPRNRPGERSMANRRNVTHHTKKFGNKGQDQRRDGERPARPPANESDDRPHGPDDRQGGRNRHGHHDGCGGPLGAAPLGRAVIREGQYQKLHAGGRGPTDAGDYQQHDGDWHIPPGAHRLVIRTGGHPPRRGQRAAFFRSMSAKAAASSARWAAEVSQESCRFLTTLAGAPTAIE
jgi:hypothetical protein